MPTSYDLTQLTPFVFEHLVNALALRVLGAGHMSFAPGPDGGRDGYFEGEAPFPSPVERWSGRWYIQCKFHAPNLSGNPQKWLLDRIKEELGAFSQPSSERVWPDCWIIATNIDPSAVAGTGAFDQAIAMVQQARPALAHRFAIWGGKKIIEFLGQFPEVGRQYGHFLTPGHVISQLYEQLGDERAGLNEIVRSLVVTALEQQRHTKLDQAGSTADMRPGIHDLFMDLPFHAPVYKLRDRALKTLSRAASRVQRTEDLPEDLPTSPAWIAWRHHPSRARVWFVRGGPGQGKSTIGQYFCQIQRAALILEEGGPRAPQKYKDLARQIQNAAQKGGVWPTVPRIPIYIELKDFARWAAGLAPTESKGVLTYLTARISTTVEQKVLPGTLKRALDQRSWFVVFDGLDEVPSDSRDHIAGEVCRFLDEVALDSDLLALCTSRPQGYAGQFSEIDGPVVELTPLSPHEALACAAPVIQLDRPQDQARQAIKVLEEALKGGAVRELMTTPLQSHIMAVIVRDGGHPPERRWELFNSFFDVIYKREANRNLPDVRLARVLKDNRQLLRALHNALGFVLHARAETSEGANTSLDREQFGRLVRDIVILRLDDAINETSDAVSEATRERLVLISTPDSGNLIRFDIRQLQEFFAAEFLYSSVEGTQSGQEVLRDRIERLGSDAHWLEVMHFLLSALVEGGRTIEAAVAADVLRRMDEGDAEQPDRMLCRRMARGALLSSRLLRDGVLEQDKRVRQQFGARLEALAATVSPDLIGPLLALRPNSARWLADFMYQRLVEADWGESVGAAIFLAFSVSDGHELVGQIRSRLLSAPAEYLGAVLSGVYQLILQRTNTVDGWIVALTIGLLASDRWREFQTSELLTMVSLAKIKSTRENSNFIVDFGMDPIIEPMLRAIGDWYAPRESEWENSKTENYGWAIVQSGEFIELSKASLLCSISDELDKRKPALFGIFELLACCLRFAISGRRQDLMCTLSLLARGSSSWDALNIFPVQLWQRIPIPTDQAPVASLLKHLDNIDDQMLAESLEKGVFGPYLLRPQQNRSCSWHRGVESASWEEFQRLLGDWPQIAASLWVESHDPVGIWFQAADAHRAVLDSPACEEMVARILLRNPSYLHHNVLAWRKVFATLGTLGEDIRRDLCAFAGKLKLRFDAHHGRRGGADFSLLTIHLPQEAVLLIPIVNELLSFYLSMRSGHEIDIFFDPPPINLPSERARIISSIERGVPNVDLLLQIVNDGQVADEVRAAALLMATLHPNGGIDVAIEHRDLLIRLSAPGSGSRAGAGFGICVDILGVETHPAVRSLLSDVLDASRLNFAQRTDFERLFALWRETGHAPLTTAGLLDKWLGHPAP